MIVTSSLFDTLGVKPERGRTFRPEDVDGPPVAVIGHDLWQDRFHAAADILGRTIALDSKTYQIVGVMPPGFGLRMIDQDSDTQFYALIQKDEAALQLRRRGTDCRHRPLEAWRHHRNGASGAGRNSALPGPTPSG